MALRHFGFKVIEIVDENHHYLTLLGIDWDFDNGVSLDLKQQFMAFGGMVSGTTLDMTQGERFIESL
jgi:hypothetical protein